MRMHNTGFCDDKGYFVHSEFLQLPEVSFCPLLKAAVKREYEKLKVAGPPTSSSELNNHQAIDFDCLVGILNKFSKEESSRSKLEC